MIKKQLVLLMAISASISPVFAMWEARAGADTQAGVGIKSVAPRRTKSSEETKMAITKNDSKKPTSHPRASRHALPTAPQLHSASPDLDDDDDDKGNFLKTTPSLTFHDVALSELTKLTKKRTLTPVPADDNDIPEQKPTRATTEATILKKINDEKSLDAINSWYKTSFKDKDLDSLTQDTKELFKVPFADTYYLLIILKDNKRSYPLLFNIAGEWVYQEESRLESFIQLATGKKPTITRKAKKTAEKCG